jgi:hypothetical protein
MNDIQISARFLGTHGVVPYERMRARLWDQDLVSDDMLGEAALDPMGRVTFEFNSKSISSIDSLGEVQPDLYIQILLDGADVFRTAVKKDLLLIADGSAEPLRSTNALDLGEFQLPDLRGLDPLSRRDFMRSFVEPPNE